MLDDRERQTLLDLERRLFEEDPGFTRSFAQLLQRQPSGAPRRVGSVGRSVITAVLILGVGLVLIGVPTVGVALAIMTGLYWLMWRYPRDADDDSS